MDKIDLRVNAKQAFGDNLPTVHINRIEVSTNDTASDPFSRVDWKVSANLTITFTKPKNMTNDEIFDYVSRNYSDIYLYAWMSPFEGINTALEKHNLHIYDLFEAHKSLKNTNIDNLTISNPFFPHIFDKAVTAIHNFESLGNLPALDGVDLSLIKDIVNDDGGASDGSFSTSIYESSDAVITNLIKRVDDIDVAVATYTYLRPDGAIAGGYEDVSSLSHYIMFGENAYGPWNSPGTVMMDGFRVRADIAAQKLFTAGIGGFYNDAELAKSNPFDFGGAASYDENQHLMDMLQPLADAISSGDIDDVLDTSTDSFMYTNLPEILAETNVSQMAEMMTHQKKIPISELFANVHSDHPSIYGGQLNAESLYDETGKELVTIKDINIDFIYDAEGIIENRELFKAIISQLPKVFFIATVGNDTEALDDLRFGRQDIDGDGSVDEDDVFKARKLKREMMNNYFGAISYMHVFNKNVVPNPYYEYYVYADNQSVYDSVPIQGMNGKFYANEPYSRKDIIEKFEKIIDKFTPTINRDKVLQNHVNNLQVLFAEHSNSEDFMEHILRFKRTFTDKSPSSASGRFYIDLTAALVDMNTKITSQAQIQRRIAVNSTVIDYRPFRGRTVDSYLPDPNKIFDWKNVKQIDIDSGAEVDDSDYDKYKISVLDDNAHNLYGLDNESDYVPSNFTKLTRAIKYINAGETGASHEHAEVFREIYDEVVEEFGDLPGFGLDALEALVAMRIEARVDEYEEGGASINADQICKNWGYFFFDYEKALYTQSNIAHLVDLDKLMAFQSLSPVYEFFKVTDVIVKRHDLRLDFPFEEMATPTMADIAVTTMHSKFDRNGKTPNLIETTHHVHCPWDSSDDTRALYGKPVVRLVDSGAPDLPDNTHTGYASDYSCVKYVQFDVLGDGVNSEHPFHQPSAGNGALYFATEINKNGTTQGNGIKVRAQHGNIFGFLLNNYRIMAFEITDYMDDDVALAASPDAMGVLTEEAESGFIRPNAGAFQTKSWYTIEVVVEDNTLNYLNKIYNEFYKPFIDSYMEYAAYAEELCSYNVRTNEFNSFFVKAMVDKYITNSPRYDDEIVERALEQMLASGLSSIGGLTDSELAEMGVDTSDGILTMDEIAKSIPPWVSAAVMSMLFREIYMNKTPRKDLVKIASMISKPLSEFDIDAGQPPKEVVEFTREMYAYSPQKGNLDQIRKFKDLIQPMVDILTFVDENARNKIQELTLLDPADADFVSKCLEEKTVRSFPGSFQIDCPIAPGNDQNGYVDTKQLSPDDDAGATMTDYPHLSYYLLSQGGLTINPPVRKSYGSAYAIAVDTTAVGFGDPDVAGADVKLRPGMHRGKMRHLNAGMKTWLTQHGFGMTPKPGHGYPGDLGTPGPDTGHNLTVLRFLKEVCGDEYLAWQDRCLSGAGFGQQRIYFPLSWATKSIDGNTALGILTELISASDETPAGVTGWSGKTAEDIRSDIAGSKNLDLAKIMASAGEHTSDFIEILDLLPHFRTSGEWEADLDGTPRPVTGRFIFYKFDKTPDGGDITASQEEFEQILRDSGLAGIEGKDY